MIKRKKIKLIIVSIILGACVISASVATPLLIKNHNSKVSIEDVKKIKAKDVKAYDGIKSSKDILPSEFWNEKKQSQKFLDNFKFATIKEHTIANIKDVKVKANDFKTNNDKGLFSYKATLYANDEKTNEFLIEHNDFKTTQDKQKEIEDSRKKEAAKKKEEARKKEEQKKRDEIKKKEEANRKKLEEKKKKVNDIFIKINNKNIIIPNFATEKDIFTKIRESMKENLNLTDDELALINHNIPTLKQVKDATKGKNQGLNLDFTIILQNPLIKKIARAKIIYESKDDFIFNKIKKHFIIETNKEIKVAKVKSYNLEEDKLEAILDVLNTKIFNGNKVITKDHVSAKNPSKNAFAPYGQTASDFVIVYNTNEVILKVNQDQYDDDEKAMIDHFTLTSNLAINLSKDDSYTNNDEILSGIKKYFNDVLKWKKTKKDLIKIDSNQIKKVVIPSYDQSSENFTINVSNNKFILRLKKDRYGKDERIKIEEIKSELKVNLNIIIPKGLPYDSAQLIYNEVKKVIESKQNIYASHIAFISLKSNQTITNVAAYKQASTNLIIIIDNEEITLKLNQAQYTAQEKADKIKILNDHFVNDNLNIIIPKGLPYNSAQLVYNEVKKVIESKQNIDASHTAFISLKSNQTITSIASHGQVATNLIVIVDSKEITLKLNQAQYTTQEKADKIKKLSDSLKNNSNLTITKNGYSTIKEIFNEVKNSILLRTGIDSSHIDFLILKKNQTITNIAAYKQTSTNLIVIIDSEEITLKLNQAQYTNLEKELIKYFDKDENKKIILPKKSLSSYDSDNKILLAIKEKLEAKDSINKSHTNLIIKKTGSNEITSIASHNMPATEYKITISGKDIVLKLNQAQYTIQEKEGIKALKDHFVSNNLNVIIPKGLPYDSSEDAFEAVKTTLELRGISKNHLLLLSLKPNQTIKNVATYNTSPTTLTVIVDNNEITLNLNQDQYTINEELLVNHFNIQKNKELIIPKTNDYDNSKILSAIKDIISKSKINGFDTKEVLSINIDSSQVNINSIANHGQTATNFKINIAGTTIELKLIQNEYTETQLNDIEDIKTHFDGDHGPGRDESQWIKLPIGVSSYKDTNELFEAIKTYLRSRTFFSKNNKVDLIKLKSGQNVTNVPTGSWLWGWKYVYLYIIVGNEEIDLWVRR